MFMKKAILVTLLIFALMLTACGNSSEKNSSKEPIDLTGNWAQEGKEFDDGYQAGYISGDRIEIFWIFLESVYPAVRNNHVVRKHDRKRNTRNDNHRNTGTQTT